MRSLPMRRAHLLFTTLLGLLASATGEEASQQQEVNEYNQNKMAVCSDAVIEVTSISLVCDSPGTYYYGSNKYRNSAACTAGDKAKLVVDIYIDDPETINDAGGYTYTTITVDGYNEIAGVTVYDNTELCGLSSLQSLTSNTCPAQGNYRITTQFYFSKDSSIDYNFVPTVTVGFKSNLNKNVYDLGGANTDLCRGNTFVTWSDGVTVSYANALENFMRTFGILVFTIAVMGTFFYWLLKRPKTFLGEERSKDNFQDEEDFRKMRLVDKDVLDF